MKGRSGSGSSKIDILALGSVSLPASSSLSLGPRPTPRVKAGDYDLRIPSSPADGLLTGGTPQQHALVELKRAIQVHTYAACVVYCPQSYYGPPSRWFSRLIVVPSISPFPLFFLGAAAGTLLPALLARRHPLHLLLRCLECPRRRGKGLILVHLARRNRGPSCSCGRRKAEG